MFVGQLSKSRFWTFLDSPNSAILDIFLAARYARGLRPTPKNTQIFLGYVRAALRAAVTGLLCSPFFCPKNTPILALRYTPSTSTRKQLGMLPAFGIICFPEMFYLNQFWKTFQKICQMHGKPDVYVLKKISKKHHQHRLVN